MALKDWKKIGKDEWSKNEKIIWIYKPAIYYYVSLGLKTFYFMDSDYRSKILKRFKTKNEALAYAKSYMRKH